MYLDFLVKVPTVKGKITRRKKSNVVYIEYEYDRVYDPSRKYTFPKRVTIGKLSDTDRDSRFRRKKTGSSQLSFVYHIGHISVRLNEIPIKKIKQD